MKSNLFPPVDLVYSDLGGRVFKHPVIHKPPWNFVTYGETVMAQALSCQSKIMAGPGDWATDDWATNDWTMADR